jgi:hypothetical protein
LARVFNFKLGCFVVMDAINDLEAKEVGRYLGGTCGLYSKCFTIVVYNHKGTVQFSAYLMIVIYAVS